MPLRNSNALTFRPRSLTDTVDATNAPAGSMQLLTNLIPATDTDMQWVPRPAKVQLTQFPVGSPIEDDDGNPILDDYGFILEDDNWEGDHFWEPGFVSALEVVGDIAYGLIGTFPGFDQPFAYDLNLGEFLPVDGIFPTNVPGSQPSSGPWTPPVIAVVGSKVVVTSTGFNGTGNRFGWFDISGFVSLPGITGDTMLHSNRLTNVSSNPINDGWTVGMVLSGPGLGTGGNRIVAIKIGGTVEVPTYSVIMSQPATATATGIKVGAAGGTARRPLWGAGDTNIFGLPQTPVSVAEMAGSAHFAVGAGVAISDPLDATSITNANQVITFPNGVAVTALGALPLYSAITGGIIQSIICFQGVTDLQQITGSVALDNVTVNALNVATGTFAPLSICNCNLGLAFVSPEGLRIINYAAQVSPPIGDHGEGVTIPLIYTTEPSRICAAAGSDILRISVTNDFVGSVSAGEYWWDLTRKTWSGPHTLPASLIQPWRNSFVMTPVGILDSLWQSDPVPNFGSTFVENGAPLTYAWQTSLLPDNQAQAMNSMVETLFGMALTGGEQVTVSFIDDTPVPLDTLTITQAGGLTLWDAFLWGGALWAGSSGVYRQRQCAWHQPLVFKQGSMLLTGISTFGTRIGDLFMRWETLGYQLENFAQAPVPPPNLRITSAGDTRVTSTGDQRVWS